MHRYHVQRQDVVIYPLAAVSVRVIHIPASVVYFSLTMANVDAAEQLNGLTHERQDVHDLSINMKILEQKCPLAPPSSIAGANTASLKALGQLDHLCLDVL